jgi:hypothetical protein
MHLDSLSNNIPSQDHATPTSSAQTKAKSGLFSSDLGNLKAISEQVEASSVSKILHAENVIEESSKILMGAPASPDHMGEESVDVDYPNSDLEETSGLQEIEDFGDFVSVHRIRQCF